jgi:hypothetical protein
LITRIIFGDEYRFLSATYMPNSEVPDNRHYRTTHSPPPPLVRPQECLQCVQLFRTQPCIRNFVAPYAGRYCLCATHQPQASYGQLLHRQLPLLLHCAQFF